MAALLATRSEVRVTEIDVLLITKDPVTEVAGEMMLGADMLVPGTEFPATEVTY